MESHTLFLMAFHSVVPANISSIPSLFHRFFGKDVKQQSKPTTQEKDDLSIDDFVMIPYCDSHHEQDDDGDVDVDVETLPCERMYIGKNYCSASVDEEKAVIKHHIWGYRSIIPAETIITQKSNGQVNIVSDLSKSVWYVRENSD
jgi:hypothetical protein